MATRYVMHGNVAIERMQSLVSENIGIFSENFAALTLARRREAKNG
jgi:hypothetical protein